MTCSGSELIEHTLMPVLGLLMGNGPPGQLEWPVGPTGELRKPDFTCEEQYMCSLALGWAERGRWKLLAGLAMLSSLSCSQPSQTAATLALLALHHSSTP